MWPAFDRLARTCDVAREATQGGVSAVRRGGAAVCWVLPNWSNCIGRRSTFRDGRLGGGSVRQSTGPGGRRGVRPSPWLGSQPFAARTPPAVRRRRRGFVFPSIPARRAPLPIIDTGRSRYTVSGMAQLQGVP